MRSATGTKSGEPGFVTSATKATMAFFGAVSCHEGSGSLARAEEISRARMHGMMAMVFMGFLIKISFLTLSRGKENWFWWLNMREPCAWPFLQSIADFRSSMFSEIG